MAAFERENPQIARYWQDPASLQQLEQEVDGSSAPLYEAWDLAAKRLMGKLWKVS